VSGVNHFIFPVRIKQDLQWNGPAFPEDERGIIKSWAFQ